MLEVLHQIRANLERQSLFDEHLYVVGRWHHDIEAVPAGLDFGQRSRVRVVVGDGDLDIVSRFEFFNQVGTGIVPPVVKIQFTRMRNTRKEESDCDNNGKNQIVLHGETSFVSFGMQLIVFDLLKNYFPNLLSMKNNTHTTSMDSPSNRVEMALISGVITRRSWPSM